MKFILCKRSYSKYHIHIISIQPADFLQSDVLCGSAMACVGSLPIPLHDVHETKHVASITFCTSDSCFSYWCDRAEYTLSFMGLGTARAALPCERRLKAASSALEFVCCSCCPIAQSVPNTFHLPPGSGGTWQMRLTSLQTRGREGGKKKGHGKNSLCLNSKMDRMRARPKWTWIMWMEKSPIFSSSNVIKFPWTTTIYCSG